MSEPEEGGFAMWLLQLLLVFLVVGTAFIYGKWAELSQGIYRDTRGYCRCYFRSLIECLRTNCPSLLQRYLRICSQTHFSSTENQTPTTVDLQAGKRRNLFISSFRASLGKRRNRNSDISIIIPFLCHDCGDPSSLPTHE